VRRSRFIGVGVGIGIDSPDAIVNVGAAHIAFLAMCAMNLPSIFAHMQRTHVCGTQLRPFISDSDPESYDIHAGSG
jgi:hypothetical protein